MRYATAMALPMLLAMPAIAQDQQPTAFAGESHALVAVSDGDEIGSGMASYYGRELAGNRTANGERFDPEGMTAAHRTLAFGSMVRVTNMATGQSVVVRINDRGPFGRGRVIDISHAAAREIGMHRSGTARVNMTLLKE